MAVTTRKEITTRTPVVAPEARAFKDYTVYALHPDGSSMPIGTVDDFADTVDVKAAYRSGHSGVKFRVIERDVDESRTNDVVIESEVK